jgi:hypothetical protein
MEAVKTACERLTFLIQTVPDLLEKIPETELSLKPSTFQWSKKEILGHLIDSAANNHQRFIRIQYEHEPLIYYDQDQWNALGHYGQQESRQLINFWALYNQHLYETIRFIPEENLALNGTGRDGVKHPLSFYIIDYVGHLEHHLRQLISY